jgi:hypothetical protein
MRHVAAALVIVSSLASAACATYSDDLVRAQRAFEGSEDERALAIFRILENDTSRLSDSERAHYVYLRGMTDFRMGYMAEARHWLSLASSMEQAIPGSLPPDWAKHLADSLKELNESVYTAGIESLTNSGAAKKGASDDVPSDTPATGDDTPPPKKAKPKPSDDN